MRYFSVNWYLADGKGGKAGKLLRTYRDDPAAPMQYAVALLEFARSGPSRKAQRRLRHAVDSNGLVACLLLHPEDHPGKVDFSYFSYGSPEEALVWFPTIHQAWEAIPGAMDWLRKCAQSEVLQRATLEQISAVVTDLDVESDDCISPS